MPPHAGRCALAAEEVAEDSGGGGPGGACLLTAAGAADERARHFLGWLHDNEPLAVERHRERLAGGASDQRAEAELVGTVESGLQ